jgi:3-hydroxyacyl-[acyl-carrier-protein] dehydratase
MRFHLLDTVQSCEPGKTLKASKFLAMGEEYLADHFQKFPVMPGVLMLQALVEAGSWLWRQTTGYQHAVIVLSGVRNVKYGTFMQPGRRMDVQVDLQKVDGNTATFKGRGTDETGQSTVAAVFTLTGRNLADQSPELATTDTRLVESLKAHWPILIGALKGRHA